MTNDYIAQERAELARALWSLRRRGQMGARYRLLRALLIGADGEATRLLARRPHAKGDVEV